MAPARASRRNLDSENMNADSANPPGSPGGPGRGAKWALIGFLAVGAFFLLSEHRAHLLGWLPWLLVLACPLMHLFHGHGKHGGDGRGNQ